ncbi:MAG TPA: thioesterase family protein [Pseudonocardiaceae bacterium]
MGVFVTEVRPRWSDMDAYGHVNNANTVTLLEEARIDLLFRDAAEYGETDLAKGVLVARLSVDYHAPLIVIAGRTVTVQIAVTQVRAASFTLGYTIHDSISSGTNGSRNGRTKIATAETVLVPYDLAAARPRRLTDAERAFLDRYRPEPVPAHA